MQIVISNVNNVAIVGRYVDSVKETNDQEQQNLVKYSEIDLDS